MYDIVRELVVERCSKFGGRWGRRNVPVRGQAETTANNSSLLKSLVRTIGGQAFARVAGRGMCMLTSPIKEVD